MTTEAPDTGTTTPDAPDTGTTTPDTGADNAEVEKWKALAKKHEGRAKENADAARELERIKAETMTETEKAVKAAREEGRVEARRETSTKLVAAEFRVVLAGRGVDADALLEGVDMSRFLTVDGDPDGAAIGAWVERIAPKVDEKPASFPDLGQGARGGSSTNELNGDPLLRDLKKTLNIP